MGDLECSEICKGHTSADPWALREQSLSVTHLTQHQQGAFNTWVLKLGEGGGERKMELRGWVVADVPGTRVSGCVGETVHAQKQPLAHSPQLSSSDRDVFRLTAIYSMACVPQREAWEVGS